MQSSSDVHVVLREKPPLSKRGGIDALAPPSLDRHDIQHNEQQCCNECEREQDTTDFCAPELARV
jgi:hypothetical protein